MSPVALNWRPKCCDVAFPTVSCIRFLRMRNSFHTHIAVVLYWTPAPTSLLVVAGAVY